MPFIFRNEQEIIDAALAITESRANYDLTKPCMNSPQAVKDFLRMKLGHLGHEVFGVLFLDAQHRVIEFREMFRGTLTQTSVYPREVLKLALELNAGACIIAHNHPSGVETPSRHDEMLTQTLKSSLKLIDVRLLDHIVVTAHTCKSFAESGLI